jgi:hypothetical protein
MARVLWLPALFLLWGAAPAAAQHIRIGPRDRVPNLPQGYCVPSAAETAGRHLKLAPLYGYRDRKFAQRGGAFGGMFPSELHGNLGRMGVRYDARREGSRDLTWLAGHLARGRPVVVVVRSRDDRRYDHAVLVTGMNNGGVTVYDPNPPHDRRHPHPLWAHRWAGGGVAILPGPYSPANGR